MNTLCRWLSVFCDYLPWNVRARCRHLEATREQYRQQYQDKLLAERKLLNDIMNLQAHVQHQTVTIHDLTTATNGFATLLRREQICVEKLRKSSKVRRA